MPKESANKLRMLVCAILPPLPDFMVVVVRAGAKPLIPEDAFSRPYVTPVVLSADLQYMMPVGLRLLRRKS